MGVSVAKMFDLLVTTLAQTPANKYRNLLLGRSYVARNFLEKARERELTGTKVLFNAMMMGDAGDTDTDATVTGMGRYDGAYDVVPIKQAEYMAQGEVSSAQYIANWSVSEKEVQLNSGKEGYIDLGKTKVEGCMTRLANILEADFWNPDAYLNQSDSNPSVLGPEYWVTDDGYHVADAAGTKGLLVGGIDPTNSAYNGPDGVNRWRNQFESCTVGNALLDSMDNLWTNVQFKAPEGVSVNTSPTSNRNRIVFNKNGFQIWKKIMRRLGEPLDPNKPTYNNVAVEWADRMKARADGTNQGFFFNLDTFKGRIASGKNFTRKPPFTPDRQPSVKAQYIDYWPCLYCEDRRMNGKLFGFGNELLDG